MSITNPDLKRKGKRTNPWLFVASSALVLTMMLLGALDSSLFSRVIADANHFIYYHFGDFYLWFLLLTLFALILLGISPLGKIRLGGPQAVPRHSYFSWFSMLFNAGMGTGMMFWGAAEPLYHFTNPPIAGDLSLLERQNLAFAYTFLHWGFSPWALYALSAVAIGFFGFNLQKGFRFSSFLIHEDPTRPEVRGKKPTAFLIDLVTILAVVFGVSATMGMGTLSLEGGLQTLTGIGRSLWLELGLIAVMTIIFLVSACNGLERGIKFLSNLSLWLVLVLMTSMLVVGPGWKILGVLASGLGMYLSDLPQLSLGLGKYANPDWMGAWTIKYWSWWIAWAPFVGIFIALISKGRTIRQIIWTVMVAPTLFSCLWFAVMGMAAVDYQAVHGFSESVLAFSRVHEVLFRVLEIYGVAPFLSWLSLFLIVIFIANSADSAAYTISCLSCTENSSKEVIKKPSNRHIMGWGALFALLAAVLLLSGGLKTLEHVTTITVLPFALLLVLVFGNLLVAMWRYDSLERKQQKILAEDASASLEAMVAEADSVDNPPDPPVAQGS